MTFEGDLRFPKMAFKGELHFLGMAFEVVSSLPLKELGGESAAKFREVSIRGGIWGHRNSISAASTSVPECR